MEGDGGEGLAGQVFVGDGLGCIKRFFVGVEAGVDVVGDDAGGERLATGGVGGDADLRVCLGRGIGLGLQDQGSEKKRSNGGEAGWRHTGIVGALLILVRKKMRMWRRCTKLSYRGRVDAGLPEFGDKKTGESMLVSDSCETGLFEWT